MKFIFTILLIVMLNGCSTLPTELVTTIGNEKTILRVAVKSAEWTDYYPESTCSDTDESDAYCFPWSYWRRYRAEVKEVVQGKYSDRYITFAYLQHAAYVKGVTKDWYISLDKFTNEKTAAQLESNYFIVDHASKFMGKDRVNDLLNRD